MEEIEYLEEYEDFIIPKNRTEIIPDDRASVDSLELLYKDLIGESPSPTEEEALLSQCTSDNSAITENPPHLQAMTAGLLTTPLLIPKPTSFTDSSTYINTSNTAEPQQHIYNCQTSGISFTDRTTNKNFPTTSSLQRTDKFKSVATVKPTLQRVNNPARPINRGSSPPLKSTSIKQSYHPTSQPFGSDAKNKAASPKVIKINQFKSTGADPLSLDDQDAFLDFDVDKPGFGDDLDFDSDLDNSLIGALSDMDSDSIDLSDDFSDNEFDLQSDLSSEDSAYKKAVYKHNKLQEANNTTKLKSKAGAPFFKQVNKKGPTSTSKSKQSQNLSSTTDRQFLSKMSDNKKQSYSLYGESKVQASFKKSQLIDTKNSSMGEFGTKSKQLALTSEVPKLSQQLQNSLSESLEKLSNAVHASAAKKTVVAPIINCVILAKPNNEIANIDGPLVMHNEILENSNLGNIESTSNVNETLNLRAREPQYDETLKVATSLKSIPPQTITDVLKQKVLTTPDKSPTLKLGSMYLKSIKPPVFKGLLDIKDSPASITSPPKQLGSPKHTTSPDQLIELNKSLVTPQVVLQSPENNNISNEIIPKETFNEKTPSAVSVDNEVNADDSKSVEMDTAEKAPSSQILSGTGKEMDTAETGPSPQIVSCISKENVLSPESNKEEESSLNEKSTEILPPTQTFHSNDVEVTVSSETSDNVVKTNELEVGHNTQAEPSTTDTVDKELELDSIENSLPEECTPNVQTVENVITRPKMPSLVYNIKKRGFKIRVNRKTVSKFFESSAVETHIKSSTTLKLASQDSESSLKSICIESTTNEQSKTTSEQGKTTNGENETTDEHGKTLTIAKELESESENKLKRKRTEAVSGIKFESEIKCKRKSIDFATDAQTTIAPTVFEPELENRPKRKLVKAQIAMKSIDSESDVRARRKSYGLPVVPTKTLQDSPNPDPTELNELDAAAQTQSPTLIKEFESENEIGVRQKPFDSTCSQSKTPISGAMEAESEAKSVEVTNDDQSRATAAPKGPGGESEIKAKEMPADSVKQRSPTTLKDSEPELGRRVKRKPMRATTVLELNTSTTQKTPVHEPRSKVKRNPTDGQVKTPSCSKTIVSEPNCTVKQSPVGSATVAMESESENEVKQKSLDPDDPNVLESGTEYTVKQKPNESAAICAQVKSPNGPTTFESESENRATRKPIDSTATSAQVRTMNSPETLESESESRAKRNPTNSGGMGVQTKSPNSPKVHEIESESRAKRKPTDSVAMSIQTRMSIGPKTIEAESENKAKRTPSDSAAINVQTRTSTGPKTIEPESENRAKRPPADSAAITVQTRTSTGPKTIESESENRGKRRPTDPAPISVQTRTSIGPKTVESESENRVKRTPTDSAAISVQTRTSIGPKPVESLSENRAKRKPVDSVIGLRNRAPSCSKSESENKIKRKPIDSIGREIQSPTTPQDAESKFERIPTRRYVEATAALQTKKHTALKRLGSEPESRPKRRPTDSASGTHVAQRNASRTVRPEVENKVKGKPNNSGSCESTKTQNSPKTTEPVAEKTHKSKSTDSASPASVNTTPLSGQDNTSRSQKLSSKSDVSSSISERNAETPAPNADDAKQDTRRRIKKGKRKKINGSRKVRRSAIRSSLHSLDETNNESTSQEIIHDESRISESQDISTKVNRELQIHDNTNTEHIRHEITPEESRTNVHGKNNCETNSILPQINGHSESPTTSSIKPSNGIVKGGETPVFLRKLRNKMIALRKSISSPSVVSRKKCNNYPEKDPPPIRMPVVAPSVEVCSRNENPLPEIPPCVNSTIPAVAEIIQPKTEAVADTVIFHFPPDSTSAESINKLDGLNRTHLLPKPYEQNRCSSNQFSSEADNSESGNDATITVFELPSFIVMKTKIINRADLPTNKAFNPPVIKQQVEEPAEEEQAVPVLKTERPEFKDICLEINSLLVRNANYLKFASGSERYNRMNQVLADATLSVEDAQCTLKFLQSYLALRSKEITVKSKGQQFIPIYDSQKKVIGYRKRTIHSKRSSSKMPPSGLISTSSTNNPPSVHAAGALTMTVHQAVMLPTKKEPQTLDTGEEEVIVPDDSPATGSCIKSEEDNTHAIALQN